MNINELHRRYSVKQFDPEKKLSTEQVNLLKNAFHLCPSSLNMQPWKLIVVESDHVKKQLAVAGKDTNAQRIEECSHLLVFARRNVSLAHCRQVVETTPIFQRLLEKFKLTTEKMAAYFWYYSKKEGGRHWTAHQVYLAFGFMLAVCAANDIGALPMEGIHRRKMDRLLKLGPGIKSVAAIAVGYPDAADADNPSRLHKARLSMDEVILSV